LPLADKLPVVIVSLLHHKNNANWLKVLSPVRVTFLRVTGANRLPPAKLDKFPHVSSAKDETAIPALAAKGPA